MEPSSMCTFEAVEIEGIFELSFVVLDVGRTSFNSGFWERRKGTRCWPMLPEADVMRMFCGADMTDDFVQPELVEQRVVRWF